MTDETPVPADSNPTADTNPHADVAPESGRSTDSSVDAFAQYRNYPNPPVSTPLPSYAPQSYTAPPAYGTDAGYGSAPTTDYQSTAAYPGSGDYRGYGSSPQPYSGEQGVVPSYAPTQTYVPTGTQAYDPSAFAAPAYGSSFDQVGSAPPPGSGPGSLGTGDGPHRRRGTGRIVLLAAVTAAVVGGGVGAGTVALVDHNDNNSTASAGLSSTTATAQNSVKIDGSVTAAAAKIQPSVVTINVTGSQESGTGSGVILRSDGYILTNDHVVSVAGTSGTISVVTTDGKTAAATIVGVDAPDDLAVIKATGLTGLTAATFAKSSAVQVGQSVVAVGAPLGLSDTVTSGIISNVARPVRSGDNDQAVFEALQTDAAINPGNSGGPLVDLNGNVVGINAAIATANSGGLSIPGQTTESGSIGIGFAIPSDEASRIAGELISKGTATHAVIGVSLQADSSSGTSGSTTGSGSSASATVGATVATVTAGSPAASAGVAVGDVVTGVDSQRVVDADSLIAAIRSHAPGDTITLTFTRGGATKSAQVKLGTSSS